MLKLEKIKYIKNNKIILDNIDLEIEKGKLYGVIGPNGSGKSTLLDVIIGHKNQSTGEIFLEGKNVKEYSPREYGRKISLVPQEFDTYFSYNAMEILEMGRYPYINQENESEKGKQLIDKFVKLFKLQELVKKSINEMSGGEKQRVLFVKALIQDTDYIFLDEATSNLDLYNSHHLMLEIKREIKDQNKGVVAVLHDMNLASLYCDKIIMLKDGAIIVQDTTENAFTCERINELFNVETEIVEVRGKKSIFSFIDEEK